MSLTKDALIRAKDSEAVDSAYRGGGVKGTGRGERQRKPLRLPPETWAKVAEIQVELQRAFPARYVTLTSTIEFLLRSAMQDFTEDK